MLLFIINTINFIVLVVLPVFKRVRLWRYLWRGRDNIEFKLKTDILGGPTIEKILDGNLETVTYVRCRIHINHREFIQWKMWEDGTPIDFIDPRKRKGWLHREHIVQWSRNQHPEIDTRTIGLNYEFMQYDIKRIWGMGGLTRWFIRRLTAEPFVMAKVAGLEEVQK